VFEGLMPAMVTPFDGEGEPDTTAAGAIVERFVEAGVSGISILGSTGEFSHLTPEERKRFAEALVEIVGGRAPLVVGVGAAGTREAIELARHAGEVGADGVLCVSPYYWKVGEEALYRHFAAVAEASPVPVIVYNFPMLTGLDLPPALVARIARECPNAVGLKDTVTEPMNTVRIMREVEQEGRPDFAVLAGFEDGILPTLLAGGDGAISGLANVAPELFVGLVRSAKNSDLATAAELHRRALALMPLYALSDPGIGAIKLAMHRLGVPINPAVRGPALPAPPESSDAIDAALVDAGLLTGASRATG
jgi:4-hydroxy-tetrahydrodipicolinate synthase